MRFLLTLASLGLAAMSSSALAQAVTTAPTVSAARIDSAISSSWPNADPGWRDRMIQDDTLKACSEHRNAPPAAVAATIATREKSSIQYPPDRNLLGDWRKGERIAQSGYGLRFTDYPPAQGNGGNCYACHRLDPKEVSHGTIGPSLLGYGKIRKFAPADVQATYDKIYNPHAALPCSLMPRFGANKVLDIEQIKDLVALLMSPDSPVNK